MSLSPAPVRRAMTRPQLVFATFAVLVVAAGLFSFLYPQLDVPQPTFVTHGIKHETVDPPWWPCTPGQIKGKRSSLKYHGPESKTYAELYDGVDCFDTAAAAEAAGYVAAKH